MNLLAGRRNSCIKRRKKEGNLLRLGEIRLVAKLRPIDSHRRAGRSRHDVDRIRMSFRP
jgi:hypothetical protein